MSTTPHTGSKWGASPASGTPGGQVTWSFDLASARMFGFDAAIGSARLQSLIRSAFDVWENLASIDFREIASGAADILLGWDSIDGRGQTLGQAKWSYAGGLTLHAEVAFDSSELWGSNLHAVAVHEIGHAIGLGHASDPGSIMYAYLGSQTVPSADDIAAIQSLYGMATARGLVLPGTAAADVIQAGAGGDTVDAGDGNDLVYGFEGHDLLRGGSGVDTLYGNQGNDTIEAGTDNDLVYGGKGNDVVQGNQGNDTVNGNLGNDTVYGGQGNDLVYGGQNDDLVFGNLGRDTLHGGLGNDTLIGGEDEDLFLFSPSDGWDVITDFDAAAGDRLDLGGQSYSVSDVNGSAVLTLSGGGTITLLGVSGATFEASSALV